MVVNGHQYWAGHTCRLPPFSQPKGEAVGN